MHNRESVLSMCEDYLIQKSVCYSIILLQITTVYCQLPLPGPLPTVSDFSGRNDSRAILAKDRRKCRQALTRHCTSIQVIAKSRTDCLLCCREFSKQTKRSSSDGLQGVFTLLHLIGCKTSVTVLSY